MNCMKCSDLHRKVMCTNYHILGLLWRLRRVRFKTKFNKNCIKCSNLHIKSCLPSPTQEVRNHIPKNFLGNAWNNFICILRPRVGEAELRNKCAWYCMRYADLHWKVMLLAITPWHGMGVVRLSSKEYLQGIIWNVLICTENSCLPSTTPVDLVRVGSFKNRGFVQFPVKEGFHSSCIPPPVEWAGGGLAHEPMWKEACIELHAIPYGRELALCYMQPLWKETCMRVALKPILKGKHRGYRQLSVEEGSHRGCM